MKQETVKHLADGATTLAVGSGANSYFGWFEFINNNAPGIGVLLSFFFGVIGLIFYLLTWRKSILAEENRIGLGEHAKKLDSHIEETRDEFKSVNNGIATILNKLR